MNPFCSNNSTSIPMKTNLGQRILLHATLLLLAFAGSGASAIPLPNLHQQELRNRQAKQQADLVIDAMQKFETHFFEEQQTKLPPITASYRRWSHFSVLSVERNTLNRTVPDSLSLNTGNYSHQGTFPQSPLNCVPNPTISVLAGGLPCKEWKWITPMPPIGTDLKGMEIINTEQRKTDQRLRLWLQTSNQISANQNQDPRGFPVTVLATESFAGANSEPNNLDENRDQLRPSCESIRCMLEAIVKNKSTNQAKPHSQLILGGFITEEADQLHIVDGQNYFVVLGYRIYTSGGILGNGGTDRTARQPLGSARSSQDRHHYIEASIHDSFKVGDYVYLSCTAGDLESMACSLDSLNQKSMMTFSKARSNAWLPE